MSLFNFLLNARTRLAGIQARRAWGDDGGIDLEANPPLDTRKWPKAEQPQPQPGSRSLLHCGNELLDIKVGRSSKARRWLIHERLICRYSEHFQNAAQTLTVRQGEIKTFDLSYADAGAFALFVDWLYNEEEKDGSGFAADADIYRDSYAWRTQCGKAWLLADYLRARVFARYALGKVIQNANWISKHTMEHEFQRVPNSPLKHFAAQWVAWRATHDKSVPWWWWGSQRSHDLQANMRMKGQTPQPLRGRTVGDPRWFEVEHWYSRCAGNLTSPTPQPCRHGQAPTPIRQPPPTEAQENLLNPWPPGQRIKLYTGNERFDRFLSAFAYKRVLVIVVLVLGIGVIFPAVYATRNTWDPPPDYEEEDDDGCVVM